MTASKNELQALSTVKTFNDLAHRAAAKGSETLALIWKAGETAKQAKKSLPHGKWMPFVEQFYDVNHKAVTTWMKFHDTVPESKLGVTPNLTAGIKMLDPPKETSTETSAGAPGHGAQTHHLASESCVADPSADTGEDGRTDAEGTEPQETAPTPPRKGKAKRGGSPPKQIDRGAYHKMWHNMIGPPARLIDTIASGIGESDQWRKAMHKHLENATKDMERTLGVE